MPYAVKAAGYGAYGSKERIAQPYCKNGVLLSEALSATDRAAVMPAYAAAYVELQDAAKQADNGDAGLVDECYVCMDDAADGDGDG